MNPRDRLIGFALLFLSFVHPSVAQRPKTIAGTQPLLLDQPLDERMVRGINQFALREIDRASTWRRERQLDYSSVAAYLQQMAPRRERFLANIGVVDPRIEANGFKIEATIGDLNSDSLLVAESDHCRVHSVRWPVLPGVTGEGLLLVPKNRQPVASVIAIPDADGSPESFVGLTSNDHSTRIGLKLVQQGCEVLVPRLINLDDEFSGHPDVRFTNQTHREFVYRTSFQVGRHVIGYEVQKVIAAVDQFFASGDSDPTIGVLGVGEGGLLALYSAAVDPRIDAALVSGYFDRRDDVWREPIYRNVWDC